MAEPLQGRSTFRRFRLLGAWQPSDTPGGAVKQQCAGRPVAAKCRLLQLSRYRYTISSPVWSAPLDSFRRPEWAKHFPGTSPPEKLAEAPLDSWKEIASYLGRDVTTVQRWEKREGMPVHRHLHDKRGSVYALGSELDAWLQSRRPRPGEQENGQKSEAPVESPVDQGRKPALSARYWFAVAGIIVLGLLAVVYAVSRPRTQIVPQLNIRSLAVLPLKNMTGQPSQEYLADGMTDALIGRLSSIHDLRVISSSP